MIPERNLMLRQIAANFILYDALPQLDVLQTLFDLFLERRLEVQLIHRVQRHDRMQQVVRIQALGANLLLALEAEQNVILAVLGALVLAVEVGRHRVDILLTITLEFLKLCRPGVDLAPQILSLGNIAQLSTIDDIL